MSPTFGEGPVLGPEATTLYCRPEAVVTTPGALAFFARKAWPSARALAASTADGGWGGAGASCARTGLDSRKRPRIRPTMRFMRLTVQSEAEDARPDASRLTFERSFSARLSSMKLVAASRPLG